MYDLPFAERIGSRQKELQAEADRIRLARQLCGHGPEETERGHSAFYRFVLVFMSLALLVIGLAGCASTTTALELESLPEGDAARGARLFSQNINGAPACSACHTIDASPSAGPSLHAFSRTGGDRIPGISAAEYGLQSIVEPGAYTVPGYANQMYANYAAKLEPQVVSDLLSFMLVQ